MDIKQSSCYALLKHQRHNGLGPNIMMDQHDIEVVKNFIYMGSEVTSDNIVSAEIKRKINWVKKFVGGL